ncbi:hypothetical protein V8E54_006278 [Elaphomyces granulatus]
MSARSTTTTHCSFSAVLELIESPRTLYGLTIVIAATLQGPPETGVPDLRIEKDIPVNIEYYNKYNEIFKPGYVAICFGSISFQEKIADVPKLHVKASNLNMYVFTIPIILNLPIPLPQNFMKYDTFNICCVLPPTERWKRVEPQTGRTMQISGDLVGFYSLQNRLWPCVVLQTMSFVNSSSAAESTNPLMTSSTMSIPRKRRQGEALFVNGEDVIAAEALTEMTTLS